MGQTKEKISTRIRRHLTNQRTDAVAMSVLDPFEVFEIEVWPLPQFQKTPKGDLAAKAHLDALEHLIYTKAIADSTFKAVLNEKDPPAPTVTVTAPPALRARIVSDAVYRIRSHPDFRTARRALILSRLAQVIAERKVQGGLRRVLLTQAKRLQWLAGRPALSRAWRCRLRRGRYGGRYGRRGRTRPVRPPLTRPSRLAQTPLVG